MKNNDTVSYPCSMTIAGSDSGGGAGIQADLRTFNAFGVFGTSAITAITAQNPTVVTAVEGVSATMVERQINTILNKITVNSIKTGMLFSAENVRAVARILSKKSIMLVVDPVMISTSGAKLLEADAIEVMKREFLPLADWITPNIPEAELLLGRKLGNVDEFASGALELSSIYGASILLKTGHAPTKSKNAIDFVAIDGELYELGTPMLELPNNTVAHGTGCTLSSALAAALALEMEIDEALTAAKSFVFGSLLEAVELGDGVSGMYPPQNVYGDKTFFRKKK